MNISDIYTRVTNVCCELLKSRGYTSIDINKEDKYILASKENIDSGGDMIVFLNFFDKFNTEALSHCTMNMVEKNISNGIAIYVSNVTSKANNDLGIVKPEINIQLFCYKELLVNPLVHSLQSKFEKLDKDEVSSFKSKHGTSFPIIKKTDIVSRFLGFSKGDIIKVTRPNGIVVYRIVKGQEHTKSTSIMSNKIGDGVFTKPKPETIQDRALLIDKYSHLLKDLLSVQCIEKLVACVHKSCSDANTTRDFETLIYEAASQLVANGESTVDEVVNSIAEDKILWNSDKFKNERVALAEQDDFIEKPFELEEGVITCNCGSKKVYTYSKQVRSGDEGYTTFAECIKCKTKWSYKG